MTGTNAAQEEYWNGRAGHTWAEFQVILDAQLEPLGREAQRVLAPRPGERVLDVGCGAGQTSLALAEAVAPRGEVLGVDLSQPLLDVARVRAAGLPVRFEIADAQTSDFGGEPFDAIYSRFGVMFFADPVAAFANLKKALKPGGRLAFVCWRSFDENDLMRAPLDAALPFIPPPAPSDPTAPGPFAFADPERIRAILTGAGFAEVRVTPFDAMIGGGDVDNALTLALRIGPLGATLRENPDLVPVVTDTVREALVKRQSADGRVLLPAAVWIVQATRP
jgi:SAM-dependent methyltransferase